jgi:Tn3 transposase DDE domain
VPLPQRLQRAGWRLIGGAPNIIDREADVLPSERCDVPQQVLVDGLAPAPQFRELLQLIGGGVLASSCISFRATRQAKGDIEHIIAHWDELLRLATSIRTGTTTSSAMLNRPIRARTGLPKRCAPPDAPDEPAQRLGRQRALTRPPFGVPRIHASF